MKASEAGVVGEQLFCVLKSIAGAGEAAEQLKALAALAGPGFGFQRSHGNPQLSVITIPEGCNTLFRLPQELAHKSRQNTHIR